MSAKIVTSRTSFGYGSSRATVDLWRLEDGVQMELNGVGCKVIIVLTGLPDERSNTIYKSIDLDTAKLFLRKGLAIADQLKGQ